MHQVNASFPQLKLMDVNGVLIGEPFTLKYHHDAGPLDFLVLRQNFDLAVQRNWQSGYRFRSFIDDTWKEGRLLAREPLSPKCPSSMFLCCRIR